MNQKKGVNNYASPPQDIIMQLILFTHLKLKINNQVSVIMTICSFFFYSVQSPAHKYIIQLCTKIRS